MTTPAEATVQLKKLMSDFHYGNCTLDRFRTSVITLENQGADLTVRATFGAEPTLLHVLVGKNKNGVFDNDISQLLKLRPALVHAKDRYGRTALAYLIASFQYNNIEFDDFKQSAMALARAGADTTVRSDTYGMPTLLGVLARYNVDGANNDDIAEIAGLNDSASEAKDKYGRTALAYLIASFQYNDIKLDDFKQSAMVLARAGADTTVRSNYGAEPTLLHVLVLNNEGGANDDAMAEVATLNASALEAKDKYGRTALAYLIASFQHNVIKLDDFKQSAMVLARAGADTTVRSNYGAEPTLLHVLVLNNEGGGNNASIATLLEKKPELINATTSRGRIPLQELLQNKPDTSVEEVDQLLQLGSNLDCIDNDGKTLLHTACATRNLDVAKHLVDKGLDLTAKTKNGSSMWHLFIPYGGVNSEQEQDTAMHEWLYEQELDINQKNNEGKTALHLAAERNNTSMMEWLMQHNADSTLTDKTGKTALQIVTENGFNPRVTALLQLQISHSLEKLKVKSASLKERGETKAFEAANTLHEQLSNSFQTYMDAPVKNKAVFETLKIEFDAAIAEARPELEKHRSVWWNNFTANLTMHIALLACTLGVGNVVALSYNYYQSGGQSMFFKMTTDSDKHVKNIEEVVGQLEQNLFQ